MLWNWIRQLENYTDHNVDGTDEWRKTSLILNLFYADNKFQVNQYSL